MELKNLTLHNFRSFYGTHSLDLEPIDDNKLIVLFGENMSGKTGIFLAIVWCLYGSAHGRTGETIPVYSRGSKENNYLINAQAVEEGDFAVHVQLQWKHGNDNWVLDRKEECEGNPLLGDHFTSWSNLMCNERILPRQEIEQVVNQQLHHEVAQFYFFDGELLSQYEKWLEDSTERETRVRRAIETTVGTAALRLHEEMDSVAREAEEAQARLVKRERREEKLVADLQSQEKRRRDIQQEIADYDEFIADNSAEANRIEKIHGDLAKYTQQQGRLQEIEEAIDDAKGREQKAVTGLQELVHNCYWLPLESQTDALYDKLSLAIETSITASHDLAHEGILRQCLEEMECKTCGRTLEADAMEFIEGQLAVAASRSSSTINVANLQEIVHRLNTLDKYRVSGEASLLEKLENDRFDARGDIFTAEDKAESIRYEHRDRPRGDHEAEMERLVNITAEITKAEDNRSKAVEELQLVGDRISKLNGQIKRIEIDPSVLKKAIAARVAADSTERALDKFRVVARTTVEANASHVFRKLVAGPEYHGISIEGDYSVVPVDKDAAVLPIPSAGGQQIVTLALIGGLNATAVHDAPLIMDTPAGRIDRTNRNRILQWIEELNQQIILMVHSGEFTATEISGLGIQIGRAFEIIKTSARTSEIRRMAI